MLLHSKSNVLTTPQFWIYPLDSLASKTVTVIPEWASESESKRFLQLSAKRRYQYCTSRWLLRHALSERYNKPFTWWEIQEQKDRPPCITNLPQDLSISLTHTDRWLAITLAIDPIGVDIEYKKEREFIKSAALFMTDQEYVTFQQSPNKNEFYRIWCLKEAFYKANLEVQHTLSFNHIDTLQIRNDTQTSVFDLDLSDHHFVIFVKAQVDAASCFLFDEKSQNWLHSELTPSFSPI